VLKSFCSALGLTINESKSTMLQEGILEQELGPFKALFPFSFEDLDVGFKYLSYFLKIGLYQASDWCWLLKKLEKKINNWCYRWLSLGGRYTLIKVVLKSQSVY